MSTKTTPGLDGLAELARLTMDGSSDVIERILSLARAALDMDVALVGRFDSDFLIQGVDGSRNGSGSTPGCGSLRPRPIASA